MAYVAVHEYSCKIEFGLCVQNEDVPYVVNFDGLVILFDYSKGAIVLPLYRVHELYGVKSVTAPLFKPV